MDKDEFDEKVKLVRKLDWLEEDNNLRILASQVHLPVEVIQSKYDKRNERLVLTFPDTLLLINVIDVVKHFAEFAHTYSGVSNEINGAEFDYFVGDKKPNGINVHYLPDQNPLGRTKNCPINGEISFTNRWVDIDLDDPTLLEAYSLHVNGHQKFRSLDGIREEQVSRKESLEKKLRNSKLPKGIILDDIECDLVEGNLVRDSIVRYNYEEIAEIPFSIPVTDAVVLSQMEHFWGFLYPSLELDDRIKLTSFRGNMIIVKNKDGYVEFNFERLYSNRKVGSESKCIRIWIGNPSELDEKKLIDYVTSIKG